MATKLFDDKTITDLLRIYEKNHSPIADIAEFREDVMRFTYIQRILKRYIETGVLNYQLLLNHIIILYNVFEIKTPGLLVISSDDVTLPYMLGVLEFLDRLPVKYENHPINTDIIKELEELIYDNV